MRYYNATACVIAGLLLLGCVPSIHPLFTPDNVVFEPDLVGLWQNEKESETLQFTKAEENAYQLVYTDKDGKTGTFQVHLTKIGDHRFLDFFPEEVDLPQNDLFKMHLIPAHTFFLVHEISPQLLRLSAVNLQWVDEHLKEHPEALKHERSEEERLILTAATEDLREFFVKHVKTPKAFGDPSPFKRVEPTKEAEEPK
jgi:hypothetical protein